MNCDRRTHKRKIVSHSIELCYLCDKLVKRLSKGLNVIKYIKKASINPITGKRSYNKTKVSKVVFPDKRLRENYLAIRYRHIKRDKVNPFIAYDDFLLVIKSNCVYCGSNVNITIDRIDSNKSYVIDNIQPLCVVCNTMKWNYTEVMFLSHVMKVCKYKQLT